MATQTTGVPSERISNATVWTGTEMIVWGGSSENTGGRYRPSTDTWSATTITGAPSGRGYHTAVWTGSLMIVWGGGDGSGGHPNSGGRYDPSTNSWAATTTTGAPSGRYGHSAVWTGTEMIVWGGSDQNTGGRYCVSSCDSPATWYPDADGDGYGVSSVGVPSCTEPPWHTLSDGDCNDGNASVHPDAQETCNGNDDNCDGQIDEGRPGGGAACATGQQGICAAGTMNCQSGAAVCTQNVQPRPETCNLLDDDCDGQTDEGNPGGGAACATGRQGICAAGAVNCQSGDLVCTQNLQPRPETCNLLDDDCDGTTDDAVGGCSLFLTNPLDGEVLDCRAGAAPPTITWNPSRYDRYRVFVSWNPTFPSTQRITSGDTLLKTPSWTVPLKKWSRVCGHAGASAYIRVLGVDRDVPETDPSRKFKSPTVAATVHLSRRVFVTTCPTAANWAVSPARTRNASGRPTRRDSGGRTAPG